MRRLLSLLVVAGLLWALPALGAVVLAYDLSGISKQSDVIARGKVKKLQGKWAGKRIVTEVTLSVEASLKGTPGAELTFLTPGGVVDGVGMVVSGAASFAEKEEVLVFLSRPTGKPSGELAVTGLGQGKYKIDRSTKETRAIPQVEGLSLMKRAASGGLTPADPPQAVTLRALETEISRALAQ